MTGQPQSASVSAHVRDLCERGYTVFERAYNDAEVEMLAATMMRLHAECGSPVCYSREPRAVGPETELCTTGLVFRQFLKRCPEHADLVVRQPVVDTVRGYLGDDMWMEISGAVINDAARPFFEWHTHIGGPDDSTYRRQAIFPHFERPERVITILYVNDIEDGNGPLLVYPRRVTDPTSPPRDTCLSSWPGEEVIRVPRGTVIVMDQCTWHAVRPKKTGGIRSYVGAYFRSARAPTTQWQDDWLPTFGGGGELLQSVLHR
jgi:hypothetical protein